MRLQTHNGVFEGGRRSVRQRVRVPLQAQTGRHVRGSDAGRVGIISRRDAPPRRYSLHPSTLRFLFPSSSAPLPEE